MARVAWVALAMSAALACLGVSSASAVSLGGTVPLTGAGSCVSEGSECATSDSLIAGADGIALSPTGNAIYVIGFGPSYLSPGGVVLAYARNPQNGKIGARLSCWTAASGAAGCQQEAALYAPSSVAVGPGDVGVYVTSYDGVGASSVIAFATNASTGALTGELDCLYEKTDHCTTLNQASVAGIGEPRSVSVSPDGGGVYVVGDATYTGTPGAGIGGLAAFARNPADGSLTFKNCITAQGSPYGDPGCGSSDETLYNAAGVLAGANNVYVASTSSNIFTGGGVSSFDRVPSTAQIVIRTGCFTLLSTGGCTPFQAPNSEYPAALALEPSGNALLVGMEFGTTDGQIATFGLDSGGVLSGYQGCVSEPAASPCTGVAPIPGLRAIAVSPDGADVYADSEANDANQGYLTSFGLSQNGSVLSPDLSCTSVLASGACSTAPGLLGAKGVAVSPDGRFVYSVADDETETLGALEAFVREMGPTCQAAAASTSASTPVAVPLSCSDSDGEATTVSIVTGPSNGTVGTPAGGSVTYTPRAGFAGVDTFTFRASDGTNLSPVATATITVNAAAGGSGGSGTGTVGPHSRVKAPKAPVRSAKLKSITGTASGNVQLVDVGILQLSGGAHAARAKPACLFLNSHGTFTRYKAGRGGTCSAGHYLRASGTTGWTLKLRRRLPRGSYIVFSRASGGGAVEAVSLRAGGANVLRLTVH